MNNINKNVQANYFNKLYNHLMCKDVTTPIHILALYM